MDFYERIGGIVNPGLTDLTPGMIFYFMKKKT